MGAKITSDNKVVSIDIDNYYLDIPKYIIVNKWDRSLQPVRVFLPKPPPLHKIDNINNPVEARIFHHPVYPQRLKDLEEDIKSKFSSGEIKETYSDQRLIVMMWEKIKSNHKLYKDEIEWIKRQLYYIRHGYWCVIENTVTYFPGWYYFYLGFWSIDDVSVVEHRERDRHQFIYSEYLYTTDENEFYQSTGSRTMLGLIYPKHRRDGATHKSLAMMYWIMFLQGLTNVNGGIQSFDNSNAHEHYKGKLISSFKKMCFFLKPLWKGTDTPERELKADSPAGMSYKKTLMNKIVPASTADRSYFDGWKLHAALVDEGGKTVNEDVKERHEVLKQCLSTSDGANIHGWIMMPSTVEDMVKKNGVNYYDLNEQSKFYDRSKSGRTITGMARYFDTSFNGVEGFIDIFGKSVMFDYEYEDTWKIKSITKDRDGNYIGSISSINSTREQLKGSGKHQDKETLQKLKKRYPIEYSESFSNIGGGVGFDIEAISSRLDDIRLEESNNKPFTTQGDFVWDIKGSSYTAEEFTDQEMHLIRGITDDAKVRFRPSSTGQCFLSYMPLRQNQSRSYKKNGVMYPVSPGKFITSIDPFTHYKKSEKGMVGEKKGTSNAGIATLWLRDEELDPPSKDVADIESNRFVLTYNHRPNSQEESLELGLMVSVFYGSLYFPENNVKDAVKYVYDRKYDGYLLFEVNADGSEKKYPGFNSNGDSKPILFSLTNTHINNHIKRERHMDLIEEWSAIGEVEEMTHYDLFTAAGGCLLGARSLNIFDKKQESKHNTTDINWNDLYDFKNI